MSLITNMFKEENDKFEVRVGRQIEHHNSNLKETIKRLSGNLTAKINSNKVFLIL